MPKAGKSINGSKETAPNGKPSLVHKVTNRTTTPTRAICIGSIKTILASSPLIIANVTAKIIAVIGVEFILYTIFLFWLGWLTVGVMTTYYNQYLK